MSKNFLRVIVLILAVVCAFASCDDNKSNTPNTPESPTHTHTFGEWVITKEKTCTEDGSKERVCSCGEKETETVYCTGHTSPSPWGCYACKEGWVTINLPETPLTVWFDDLNAFKITELRYELGRNNSSNSYIFKLIYSGEKVIDNSTRPSETKRCQFEIKLVDSEGYVIFTQTVITDSLDVGDKLKDSNVTKYNLNLDPKKTYTLIISDS